MDLCLGLFDAALDVANSVEILTEFPAIPSAKLAADGLSAQIVLSELKRGHVHEFDLGLLRGRDQEELLHRHAYYTVNEVPKK